MLEMKKYKLSEIASFIGSGMTPLRSNENYWNSKDYPWLKTEQLGEYQIFDTSEYISKVALEETNLKLFPKNTLSVAMYGEGKTRGNVSILAEQMTTNQACCNIIVDNKFANYKFVYYWLKNSYYKLRSLSSGIRNNLNSEDIKKFEINLPSLPTQQKIAAVLSSLDDKIALNKKINAKLEAMAKRLYDYWFVQFDYPDKNGKPYKTSGGKMVWNEVLKRKIPKGWEVVEMSSVIKQINTGLNPRDNFILGNGKIKYVTVKNLTEEGHIDFSNCDLVNSEAQKIIHERSQIQKGDILFASICPLGRCYLIQDSPEDWDINESVFSIRPNIDKITSEFLYTLLREAYYVKKMTQKATGSIFKGIRINDIEKIEIVLPPKEVINAFSKKTLPIFNYQLTIQKEIQKLTDLRDRLLPLLMNGQVELE
ncbi:MAG: restriction endonuclease subunit S [Treponema sp.]|nr:restriction endonuclease subunit S [Treponema sp.]